MSQPFLLEFLKGKTSDRFPVWMMRQAGRYLPSYRAVRKDHSFWEMVTRPELSMEVSLQPVDQLGVDAVIFFSDILTLPYGQGIPIELREGVGPVLETPLSSLADFEIFRNFDAQKHTPYVGEALSQIREKLSDDKALIGFAGTPWTVGCYLIEGRSTRDFGKLKTWMYRDPQNLIESLSLLSSATLKYVEHQIENGAQAIQLFDSWLGEMPLDFYATYYRPLLLELMNGIKAHHVPLFYYTKHAHHLWSEFKGLPIDVLSVDSLLSLPECDKRLGGEFHLQGNLDPILMRDGSVDQITQATQVLVSQARTLNKPAILNLGHGILKQTPVENARAFVQGAQAKWT